MPLYDFKCPNCGATREVLVREGTPVPVCRHASREVIEAEPVDGSEAYRLGELRTDLFLMERQFPNRTGAIIIEGFSSENGYSKRDERFKPVAGQPGVKVQVRKGRGWKD